MNAKSDGDRVPLVLITGGPYADLPALVIGSYNLPAGEVYIVRFENGAETRIARSQARITATVKYKIKREK